MKNNNTYQKILHLVLIGSLLPALILISACPNPLVGLGPGVDVENPEGIVLDLENGDYVNGEILLRGTAEDDVKIKSVMAQIEGRKLTASLQNGEVTNWEIPVDTTEWSDGEYTIIITITDSTGKSMEDRLLLYFDNTPPTVLITSGEGITDDGASNSTVTVRGEAYDYPFSRLDSVSATVITGSADAGTVQGKNGWSFPLQTLGTGTYEVQVTAKDMAGNENTFLYHIYEVPSGTKIEDIADADAGLSGDDFSTYRRAYQDIEVDMSQDEPKVEVSNPSSGIVVGGTAVAVGYIEDDDEVDPTSLEISFDDGLTWSDNGIVLDGSGTFVRWSYDLSVLSNGNYVLKVRAKDTNKQSGEAVLTGYSPSVPFTIDKDAPTVSITSPEQGAYLNTTDFTVEGEASDPGGQITDITISLNGGESQPVSFSPGEIAPWTYSVNSVPEGALTMKVVAKDDSNKSSTFSQQVNLDIQNPEIEVLAPSEGLFVNGTISLRGINSDNWSLSEVKIQIGGSTYNDSVAESLAPDEFYSWSRSIVTSNYETPSLAEEVDGNGNPATGTGIWKLKTWIKATDMAGNESLKEHYFYIDNSLDRPGVSIASPSDGTVLAGAVNFAGNAWDDRNEVGEELDHVEIRVWKGQDGSFNETFDLGNLGGDWDPSNNLGDGWYRINGTSSWSQELNTNGEFYPDGVAGHDGTCKLEVRAVDQKNGIPDVTGNAESVIVTFDDTVPYFENLNYTSGDYVKGSFDLTGTVKDDEGVTRLRISYNGGVDWEIIGSDLGIESPFSHTIDTTDPAIFSDTAGILYLRLEVLDSANYKSIESINLNVDNVDPSGSYTAPLSDLSGTARVQGTAADTGSVSGIERIEVSFEQSGVSVNPEDSTGVRHPIVINTSTEEGDDGGSGGDGDGFDESLTLSGSTYDWWADFDSLSFEDGAIDVLYTVHDKAGNTYAETVSGNIKNHAPEISSIGLAWDLDHDATIEGTEETIYNSDSSETNPVFGDIDYLFTPDYDDQNGNLTYTAQYSSDGGSSWTDLSGIAASGTIDTTILTDGAYELRFTVTDEKNYSDSITISLQVANTDTVNPTIEFYELDSDDAQYVTQNALGHIELDDLYGTGNKAVSGTVRVSGLAEDDQQIQKISLVVNNNTTPVVIAEWNGSELIANSGCDLGAGTGFVESAGSTIHRANWEYEWDSASDGNLDGVGQNVSVEFIVEDKGGNTQSFERIVDVVPYVSDVKGELEDGTKSLLRRTAQGAYPVRRDQQIEITGYNLESTGGTQVNIDGTLDSVSPISLLFTLGSAAETGPLTVTVDGIEAVNNINDNLDLWNQEPSAYRPDINDDRYLFVWGVASDTSLSGRSEAVMGPDSAGTGFDWMNVENSQKVYINNQVLSSSWTLKGGWFDRNADGTLMYIFLHDMNWRSGDDGYQYQGSVQFGMGDVDNGGAYNWQNTQTNRLGLGNLSFIDDPNWSAPYDDKLMSRYENLKIQAEGTDAETDVYAMYFDRSSQTRSIVYYTFKVGQSLSAGDQVTQMEGIWWSDLTKQAERTGNYSISAGTNVGLRTPQNRVDITSGGSDSKHFDFKYQNGVLYLVYYDETVGALKLSSNSDPVASPASWSVPIQIDTSAGLYPALDIDPNGGIHIAYYDTAQSNLKYVYMDSLADTPDPIVADALFTNGMYNSIEIKEFGGAGSGDYRPLISSFSLSYSGTAYSLRFLYPTHSVSSLQAGAEVASGDYTGEWEMVPVMAEMVPGQSNTFTRLDPNGNPVVGYSGQYVEEATLYGLREE